MATLTDLRTRVSDNLDESIREKWSNVQLRRFINRAGITAQKYVMAIDQNYVGNNTYTSSVLGQELYDLPADCLKIKLVEDVSGNYPVAISPINMVDRNKYVDSGYPTYRYQRGWYQWGNQIGLLPVATETKTSDIRIWYLKAWRTLPEPVSCNSGVSVGTATIYVTTTLGFAVGDVVRIAEGTLYEEDKTILSIPTSTDRLNLTSTLTYAHTLAQAHVVDMVSSLEDTHDDLVVLKATISALGNADDTAEQWRADYNEQLQLLKTVMRPRQSQEPRKVREVR